MKFRRAHRSETRAVAELWVHTFPGDRSLAERIHTLETAGKHGGIETVIVAEENGRLAAALKTTGYRQYIAGEAMPMLGLAAVGVAPWARRRGLGTVLCQQALEESFRRGDAISVLYPFRPEFYRRLGWGLAGELHSYTFAPEQLPDVGDPRVHLATAADRPAIAACYDHVARTSNGLIERDEFLWRKHLDATNTHAWIAEGDPLPGYLIVRYGRARSPDRRPLHIRELVARDDATYARLLGWISRQRDLWRRVRYDALPAENFALRLRDPRPPGYRGFRGLWANVARIIRGPMVRIINVVEALRLRKQWGGGPLDFSLRVEDTQLPQNRGPWRVDFDGRSVTVTKSDGRENTWLHIDAPTLAQVFVGELTVSAAVRMGNAQAAGLPLLDAFFVSPGPFWLLDEF